MDGSAEDVAGLSPHGWGYPSYPYFFKYLKKQGLSNQYRQKFDSKRLRGKYLTLKELSWHDSGGCGNKRQRPAAQVCSYIQFSSLAGQSPQRELGRNLFRFCGLRGICRPKGLTKQGTGAIPESYS